MLWPFVRRGDRTFRGDRGFRSVSTGLRRCGVRETVLSEGILAHIFGISHLHSFRCCSFRKICGF